MKKIKTVFLDRDGTIIKDKDYLSNPEEVELLPGAGKALADLKNAGFLLIIVTNQSGVGRGFFQMENVRAQNNRLQELLAPFGVQIDGFEVCPHTPEADCECRKPAPTMLVRAAEKHRISLAQAIMIGDKSSDVTAGKAAGCRTILLGDAGDEKESLADVKLPDITAAADFIIRGQSSSAGYASLN